MDVRVYGYFLCRGQISRDYEQEFPSVEVGPQLIQDKQVNCSF